MYIFLPPQFCVKMAKHCNKGGINLCEEEEVGTIVTKVGYGDNGPNNTDASMHCDLQWEESNEMVLKNYFGYIL